MAASTFTGQVYKLLCDDGHYYIGSTKTDLKYRLYFHKKHACEYPDRKVYKHILECGWDAVKMTCIEAVTCNSREDLLKKENEHIKKALSDPLCLNIKKAHLTKAELLAQQKEYLEANKDKVDEYQAEYRIKNAEKRREYTAQYAAEFPDKIKDAAKVRYETNKAEILEKQKAYIQANKEEICKKSKEWREKNKEKIAAEMKVWAEKNKEKIQEKGKKYYEENKDIIREKNRAYVEENKVALLAQQKEYRAANKAKLSESHICDCGGKYTMNHEKIHRDSKRHKKYLEAVPVTVRASLMPTGSAAL